MHIFIPWTWIVMWCFFDVFFIKNFFHVRIINENYCQATVTKQSWRIKQFFVVNWRHFLSNTSGLPAHTFIERYVTIGASSLLRSCTIEPECIVGQHSILMEGSMMETHSILEAGSVVPPGRRIPAGELWAGNPARFVRTLTHEETLEIPKLAVAINDLSTNHFSEFLPYSVVYLEVEKLKKSFNISIWWASTPCSVHLSVSFWFYSKGE